jgi:hypothetical protein
MNEQFKIRDSLSEKYYRDVKKGIKRGIALKLKEIKSEARIKALISAVVNAKAQAETQGIYKSALKLLQKGFTAKQVVELLDLNLSDVESLKKS